jgi:hypothetical protein
MGVWMAVLLAAAVGGPPEEDALPRSLQLDDDVQVVEGLLSARLGVWAGRSFQFEAVRTDSTQASTKHQAFFSASLLAGAQFYEHFVVLGTYEASMASKMTISVGGAYLGYRDHPKKSYGKGVPDEVMIYAGVLFGHLDVDQTDFGSFDRGIGFGGGLEFGWSLSSKIVLEIFAEFRSIKFDYRRDVVSGDDKIGGSSGWFGVGIDFRF